MHFRITVATIPFLITTFLYVGKRIVKLEISTRVKTKTGNMKSYKHSLTFLGLELKLDELRKQLSSTHGGIFPHSVLSTQQISILSAQKPTTIQEASSQHLCLNERRNILTAYPPVQYFSSLVIKKACAC